MQSNQVIISISIGIDGVSSQAQVEAQSGGRPAWDKLQCVLHAQVLHGVVLRFSGQPQISDVKFQTLSGNNEQ
jgi:hypothetical protein